MKPDKQWKNKHKKEAGILERCKNIVRKIIPESDLILYGSVARGTHTPDSDMDILILTDKQPDMDSIKKIRSQIFDIELEKNIIIDTLCYQRSLWNSPRYRALPIHEFIDKEGIII
jgi:DNA polymerase sigma